MTALVTTYVALLFFAAFIAVGLGAQIARKTHGRGVGGRFLYVFLAGFMWPLMSALSAVSSSESSATSFLLLRYAVMGFTGVFMMRFSIATPTRCGPFDCPSRHCLSCRWRATSCWRPCAT